MLPQCSHITRKRGRYYFRRRLSEPYRGEVAVALRTANYREAQHLGTVLDSAFREFMQRRMPPTADLQEILRVYLKEALHADLEQHRSTRPGQPVYTALRHEYQDPIEADLELVEALYADAADDLVRRDTRNVSHIVQRLMAEHGLPEEMRTPLAFGVLQAQVQILEKARERVTGGAAEPITLRNSADIQAAMAAEPRDVRSEPAGLVLSELLPDFLQLVKERYRWRGQTFKQNSTTYRLFIEHCGDRAPGRYMRADLASFYSLLERLPALYAKSPQWRGLSLAQIAEHARDVPVGQRLTMKTIKRHFSALGKLFKYFKQKELIVGENPAHGFEFPKGREQKRQLWEADKLAKLFASPVWTGCKSKDRRSQPGKLIVRDEKFWLPILGLYHGNRLEEFAQLRREDVRREGGIWHFYIHDGGERQIKNDHSRRRVPLHPKVQALGFLQYVEETAPRPNDLVFPELRPGGPDKKLGTSFTKWWTRYRKAIGVYQKWLDYHSFRHGVTTKLYAAGCSTVIVDELTGHEGKGTSENVYLHELPLSVLYDAISKVEWPEVSLPAPAQRTE